MRSLYCKYLALNNAVKQTSNSVLRFLGSVQDLLHIVSITKSNGCARCVDDKTMYEVPGNLPFLAHEEPLELTNSRKPSTVCHLT